MWASTLTKVNTLETTFAKGLEAKAALEGTLIAQVALDLEADYGYEPSNQGARTSSGRCEDGNGEAIRPVEAGDEPRGE